MTTISPQLQQPERGFVSANPAASWNDALLCGNGVHGAMVYGEPFDETIIVSRSGLFMPLERPLSPPDTASRLGEIRELLASGDPNAAAELVVAQCEAEGWGSEKRWTDPFIPACDLHIVTENADLISSYSRSVDFATGVASVAYSDVDGEHLQRTFVSRADDVIVVRCTSDTSTSTSRQLAFAVRPTEGQGGWRPQWFFDNGIADVQIGAHDGWLTYCSTFARTYSGSLAGYEVVARVIAPSTVPTEGDKLVVVGSDITVLIRVALLREGDGSQIERLRTELAAIDADYDSLLARHEALHRPLFERSRLRLSPSHAPVTSEELIANSDLGATQPQLLDTLYDAGRYIVLSSTGELPPTLCGIWSGTWGAAWSGDFTQNGNLQTAIAANFAVNWHELMEPYFAYQERLIEDYRTNAQRLYGARGILMPSRTSTHGLNNHVDATWPMSFWTAGAPWAAQFFYDHYLHTGDIDFLRNRAIPFMREAALFYENFVIEGEDGVIVFNPSYSPENNPADNPSQACVNATMDLTAASQLLRNLLSALDTIGSTDDEERARYRTLLSKLPDYRIDSDGALKEWISDAAENNEHRHSSHMYALYYGMPRDIERDPALVNAFRKALDNRLEYRRREPTGEMAFGLVQMGQVAASLGDSETCLEIVDWLANWYWSAALSSTHNRHEIFNVDICGGLPYLLTRLLVASHPGHIDLLPALPYAWSSGAIDGVLCRGAVLIEHLEWTPETVIVKLTAKFDGPVTISFPATHNGQPTRRCGEADLTSGETATFLFERGG